MKKLSVIILLLAVTIQSAIAVPARRDVVKQISQPDGSVISVKLVGDERSHCYTTTDNIPLLTNNDGYYCYATLATDGTAIPSNIVAREVNMRSISDTKFIAGIDVVKVGNKILSRTNKSRPAIHRANQSSGLGLFGAQFPGTGEVHTIVILVEYADVKFSMSNAGEYYNNFMNQIGFNEDGATGSVGEYFATSSMGKFKPIFDAYGPVTLSQNRSYYGENDFSGNDKHADEMVVEACELLDDQIDFTKYDYDNDGFVDNIYVIYAGKGEATGGPANSIWPHQYELRYTLKTLPKFDGMTPNCYGCCNEYDDYEPAGIGVFCHEFGHVIGLPDLYSTSYNSAAASITPGSWSIMDYGSYNNDGRTPPVYSAFERNALGWLDPIELTGPASISLPNLQETGVACIVNTASENEFFLFENRQQTGWDAYLPGHGMLIWHIDYNRNVWTQNAVNDDSRHQYVDIEEANNRQNNDDFGTMRDYAFPGTSGNTSFTDNTTPSMKTWAGVSLNTPIENIAEINGVIYFDVCGGKVELDPPAPTISDINAGGFTVNWNAIDNATSYLVSIYTDAELTDVVPAYNAVETAATSFVVTRLNSSTTYYVAVTAKRNTIIGDEPGTAKATTSDFDFTLAVPEVLSATDVSESSFTANWSAVEGASDYLLTVYADNQLEQNEYSADFGTGTNATLPDGWKSSSSQSYSSTNYYGDSAPAIKLSDTGDYISTPIFDNEIIEVSLWLRLAGSSTSNYIEIDGYLPEQNGGEWIHMYKKDNLKNSIGGEVINLTTEIPSGVRCIRINYYKKTSGNLAIDDIKVTTGGIERILVDGYDKRSVGNIISYNVTGLSPANTIHYYSVIAKSANGATSLESDLMKVERNNNSGITDAEIDSAPIEYFNLQGIRVDNPELPGIYIRRQGNRASKVLIR